MQFSKYIFIVFILLSGSCFFASAQEVPLTVVGNSRGVPTELKLNALKSILKGEKQRWPDGTKVVIALMKTSTPVGNYTCRKIYNMSGDELNKFFLALVFQGKGQAPSFFNSVSELESFVAQTPGAIGITGPAAASVRTIEVEGKKTL